MQQATVYSCSTKAQPARMHSVAVPRARQAYFYLGWSSNMQATMVARPKLGEKNAHHNSLVQEGVLAGTHR